MSFAGIVLILVGFIVVIPSGALPGSTAGRSIRIGAMPIARTPGYRPAEEGSRKTRVHGIAVGLLMIVAGIVLLVISS